MKVIFLRLSFAPMTLMASALLSTAQAYPGAGAPAEAAAWPVAPLAHPSASVPSGPLLRLRPRVLSDPSLPWPSSVAATVGHALVLPLPGPVQRIVVGDPTVADYRVTSRAELYVLGKAVGSTNLLLWPAGGAAPMSLAVTVGMDLRPLALALKQSLADEPDISLRLAAGSVVLSGQVSTAQASDAAQRLAQAFMGPGSDGGRGAPASNASGLPSTASPFNFSGGSSGGSSGASSGASDSSAAAASPAGTGNASRVINLLQVRDMQQVLLDVRIAEVSKSLLEKLGLGVQAAGGGDTRWRILSNFLGGGGGVLDLLFRNGNALTLEAEKKDGMVKVLAEPTLVAMSGQEGSFLVGGKVFIPVAQSSTGAGSNITLQEREFGVGLKFVPSVVDATRVNLKVATEVSEISRESASVRTVGGTLLPAFTTRRVATSVQLQDGQSLVIGGLIRNNSSANISAFPVLGELPVIGALFRSTQFNTDQTELVVVVRATLVKPQLANAVGAGPALPTDTVQMPSRRDLFLNGQLQAPPAEPAVLNPPPGVRDAPSP